MLFPGRAAARCGAAALALATVAMLCGCGDPQIAEQYGRRRGEGYESSVNGTSVLAEMFTQSGRRVFSWRRLSPRLDECQTIVWYPDQFGPPAAAARVRLEQWLADAPNRTVIYVGRDYDAAEEYWSAMQPTAPPQQQRELARRRATSQSNHDRRRAALPADKFCNWFTLRGQQPTRQVTQLAGPWAEQIDAAQVRLRTASQLDIPSDEQITAWTQSTDSPWHGRPQFSPLLLADDQPFVYQVTCPDWGDSRLIVVNNGSFLLNLPLVNHQHRKLAQRLIASCDNRGRTAFLETGPDDPVILDEEPDEHPPTGFEVFTIWPLGIILMHLLAAGIIAGAARFPVFGRPREAPQADAALAPPERIAATNSTAIQVTSADFGKHIVALGELLAATDCEAYALQRVTEYHQNVRRDSGGGHRQEQGRHRPAALRPAAPQPAAPQPAATLIEKETT